MGLGVVGVVLRGFEVLLDDLFRGALCVVEALIVVFVLFSVELVDLGAPVEAVDEFLFVLPVVALEVLEVLVPLDSERAFLSVLILCAFTPARVASTGAAKILITDATSIAQKKEALDGL